ncbi:hypothetical protein K525DRAFT_362440 [Schizophyllum commune Loenen D]|nr:hypothetical protein K525DRAFT_362440 [Schizophyllum commune Loenen D]
MSDGDSAQEKTEPQALDRQSPRFASTDEDAILFRSVDGTLFNIHRCNLRCATDGPFAEDFPATSGEKVELTEDADTLETLFSFVYPGVYPSLVDMPFAKLALVAEAAEKYRVASAMAMCRVTIRLGALYKEHAAEALQYAYKHGYEDLLNLAAPYSLTTSVRDVRKMWSCPLIAAWAEYKEAWLRAFREDCYEIRHRVRHPSGGGDCMYWSRVVGVVDTRASDAASRAIFGDLDALFDGATQSSCGGGNELFRQKTSAIPSLSTFISQS